jgi:hypothetical protein
MSALASRLETAPSPRGAVESNDMADLARIHEPGVNLCLIHRQPEAPVRNFVTELLRLYPAIELAEELVFERFDFASLLSDFEGLHGHGQWWRDVALLTCACRDLFGVERVGLRLRTLDKPMCPRFHVDHVTCRLVCTYGGMGTEWLPDDCVDRSKLGPGAKGLPDSESGVILDETAIRVMPPYAVGLMKGARWEGNEAHGLVHRSPRCTPERPRRLLLTLDMLGGT